MSIPHDVKSKMSIYSTLPIINRKYSSLTQTSHTKAKSLLDSISNFSAKTAQILNDSMMVYLGNPQIYIYMYVQRRTQL